MSVLSQAISASLIRVEIQVQTRSYFLIFIVAIVQEQKWDAVTLNRSPNLLSATQLLHFVLSIA